MMKIYLALFIFIFFISIGYTQTTFSKAYSHVKGNEVGRNILNVDKGFFVITSGVYDPALPGIVGSQTLSYMNKNGELQNSNVYIDNISIS